MKIALATPSFPTSIADAVQHIRELSKKAAQAGAVIVCFPESYVPGYPWPGYTLEQSTPGKMQAALKEICQVAAENSISVIVPMDWYENGSYLNVAHVISAKGEMLGYQSKNQLDPSEDTIWVPGKERRLFEIAGLKFGIVICHEGFRYPELTRWAAMRGAQVVFHPFFAGGDITGKQLTEYGNKNNPYYEKAAMMRALENTIYFASVNYATRFSEAASAVIAPDGSCVAHHPYSEPGVLIASIDPKLASGLLAKRFKGMPA